ncbi:MAG: ATP-binding protein [Myxococcota bacterium]
MTDPSVRWRAQLLASLTLAGTLLVLIILALAIVAGPAMTGPAWWVWVLSFGLWVSSYTLARSPMWRLGAWLAVITIGGPAVIDIAMRHNVFLVVFIGLAITLAGMVLRKRDTLALVGIALVGTWTMPLWSQGPSGTEERALISAFFVGLGLLLRASIGMREEIERRRLEELSRNEARYRGLLEVAFEGLVVLKNDCIVDLNPGFVAISGRSRSELLGRELTAILELEPGKDGIDGESIDSVPSMEAITNHPKADLLRKNAIREATGQRPNGEVFHVELVGRVQDSDRGLVRYMAVRDITERRRATLQLSIAHRAVALGTLSAGIAHEINNPLSWMMTNLQMAQDELRQGQAGGLRLAPAQQAMLRTLDDALSGGRRVMAIVRDLKTLSRHHGKVGTADVHAALDLACRIASRQIEARARLVRDYGHVPSVVGSEGRLGQVFLNLLTNAVQAIPEGERDMHRITLRTRSRGKEVEVSVRDDGRGIPASVLPHIFDPFHTTRSDEDGTGLGLSISRNIIDGMGGTINVDSRVGEGTTFTLCLPVAERPEVTATPAARATTSIARAAPNRAGLSGQHVRVLVIDDEPLLGKSLRRALREHEVIYTEDPARALELCSETDFDVIVCDVMMPVISGENVYDSLKERAPELADRMIFMTGGAFTAGAQDFLQRIDNPVLIKPFSPNDLRVAVRRMLEMHAA